MNDRVHELEELSAEDLELIRIYEDPVTFARVVLKQEPRWYQENMIRDSSIKRVWRCGRRVGKTFSMVLDIIHGAYTQIDKNPNSKDPYTILIAAPYESQVAQIFDQIRAFIDYAGLRDSIKRDVRSPQRIEWMNGTIIKGFTSGTRSGANGDSMRGQRADRIYLDEVDRMSEADIDSILAIRYEDPTRIKVSSLHSNWAPLPSGSGAPTRSWLERKSLSQLC